MIWPNEPMTWTLLGVAGGVVLGVICLIWASQGKALSEASQHEEH
jgi:hypothetical protein